MTVWILVCTLTLAGCASTPARTRSKEEPMVTHTQSAAPQHTPLLVPLPIAGGRYPMPAGWTEGGVIFDRAFDLASKGNHAEAAELFMDSAESFRVVPSHTHAGTFGAARDVAYANAWECYQAANLREDGKQRLERAAKGDQELAKRIRERLKEEH